MLLNIRSLTYMDPSKGTTSNPVQWMGKEVEGMQVEPMLTA